MKAALFPFPGEDAATQQVLVVPARTPAVSSRKVFFMFVLRQVTEVLRKTAVYPVPFAPPHLPGIARWRGRVVPVLSLEGCLSLAQNECTTPDRLMAVRTRHARVGAILKIDPGLRLIHPPAEARPAEGDLKVPPPLIRGVYEWTEGLLIVPHLENILSGKFAI
jgi:chemotaxis signal transduction protein